MKAPTGKFPPAPSEAQRAASTGSQLAGLLILLALLAALAVFRAW
jgi:hypothetical protein